VPLDDIEVLASERDYLRIRAADGDHLIRQSMRALEAALEPGRFLRVHRSILVNPRRVLRVERLEGGRLELRLVSGRAVPVSGAYAGTVLALGLPLVSRIRGEP
jgi:two-component system LytT family response regulator